MEKYVFFDIDGTLLDQKIGVVPDSAKRAVEKTQKAGNKCFLCTGRNVKDVKQFASLDMDGAILCNGGAIMWNHELLKVYDITPEIRDEMFRWFTEHHVGMHINGLEATWSNTEWIRMREAYIRIRDGIKADEPFPESKQPNDLPLSDYHGEPVLKIDCRFPEDGSLELFQKRMDSSLVMTVDQGHYSRGGSIYTEITPRGITKGNAIQELVTRLNGEMKNTYGFGDSENDISMLEVVNTPIVMGNASERMKTQGYYVTDCVDQDGIYNACEHFKLMD